MKKVVLYSDFSEKKNLQVGEEIVLTPTEKLIRVLDMMDLHIAIRAANPIQKRPDSIPWIELKFKASHDKRS